MVKSTGKGFGSWDKEGAHKHLRLAISSWATWLGDFNEPLNYRICAGKSKDVQAACAAAANAAAPPPPLILPSPAFARTPTTSFVWFCLYGLLAAFLAVIKRPSIGLLEPAALLPHTAPVPSLPAAFCSFSARCQYVGLSPRTISKWRVFSPLWPCPATPCPGTAARVSCHHPKCPTLCSLSPPSH